MLGQSMLVGLLLPCHVAVIGNLVRQVTRVLPFYLAMGQRLPPFACRMAVSSVPPLRLEVAIASSRTCASSAPRAGDTHEPPSAFLAGGGSCFVGGFLVASWAAQYFTLMLASEEGDYFTSRLPMGTSSLQHC